MAIDSKILKRLRENDPTLLKLDLSTIIFGKLKDPDILLLCDALKNNTQLFDLNLEGNNITDIGIQALAQIKTLTHLNLSSNEIGKPGMEALAQNQTLKNLIIKYNPIGDSGAEILAQNQALTYLNLEGSKIGDSGAGALGKNQTLVHLHLDRNKIGDIGAQALAQNKTLSKLSLSSNSIGDGGGQALAQNKTLRMLDLQSNKIGDIGAQDLAQNQTLVALDLSSNQIADAGAQAFGQNQTLVTLDLSSNYRIETAGIEGLAQNQTLTDLDVYINTQDKTVKAKLKDRLEANKQTSKSLITACQSRSSIDTSSLLQKGVRPYGKYIQSQLPHKDTLLHLAVRERNGELLSLLLPNNPDKDVKNKDNLTYIQLAQQIKFPLPQASTTSSNSTTGSTQISSPDGKIIPTPKKIVESTPSESNNNNTAPINTTSVTPNPFIDAKIPQQLQNNGPKLKGSSSEINSNNSANSEFAKLSLSDSFLIPYSNLKLDEKLGEGAYGVVFKAKQGYETVAVKQLTIDPNNVTAVTSFQNEAEHMSRLHSNYTVRLLGICNQPYCLILEFMSGGSLYGFLQKNQPTAVMWLKRIQLALDISYGLAYLHSKQVIHRDLKSLNVLLDEKDKAKLSDFGLTTTKATSSSAAKTKSACGTTAWMAPELLDPDQDEYEYNTQTDIFAYAMVLYELASHKTPFCELKEGQISRKIENGNRPEMPESSPAAYKSLVIRCWDQTPDSRPAIDVAITELSNLKQMEEAKTQLPEYSSMFTN